MTIDLSILHVQCLSEKNTSPFYIFVIAYSDVIQLLAETYSRKFETNTNAQAAICVCFKFPGGMFMPKTSKIG